MDFALRNTTINKQDESFGCCMNYRAKNLSHEYPSSVEELSYIVLVNKAEITLLSCCRKEPVRNATTHLASFC
jgi:hypothetical protein